jgi:hypothetical protein
MAALSKFLVAGGKCCVSSAQSKLTMAAKRNRNVAEGTEISAWRSELPRSGWLWLVKRGIHQAYSIVASAW